MSRSRFFRRLIAQYVDLSTVERVLDVGAGDGWFAQELVPDLAPGTAVTCWDVNYRSEDLATPAAPGIVRTTTRPPASFDVVLVLDVLEHVDAAEPFLADEVVPAIGGVAVFSVPAHPWLFSEHDRMLAHHRRYVPAEFEAMLSRHLQVVATGSLFTTLLVPRLTAVALQRLGMRGRGTGVGAWTRGPLVSNALTAVLDADTRAASVLNGAGLRVPGLSTWAVARRRST